MRKFYKTVGTLDGAVLLDGKPLKTPLRHKLAVPLPLAAAIAEEWRSQGDDIIPASMPLTQLANVMIDKAAGPDRPALEQQVQGYGASDLVCYFATHPQKLVALHEAVWRPLLAWLAETQGVTLMAVSGIQYHPQSPGALQKLREVVSALDAPAFTVVQAAAAATGSLVISLALLARRLTPEAAWQAACIDEIYQLETWGEDDAARKRLNMLRAELDALARFRDLLDLA